jgi:hypothetical protein
MRPKYTNFCSLVHVRFNFCHMFKKHIHHFSKTTTIIIFSKRNNLSFLAYSRLGCCQQEIIAQSEAINNNSSKSNKLKLTCLHMKISSVSYLAIYIYIFIYHLLTYENIQHFLYSNIYIYIYISLAYIYIG